MKLKYFLATGFVTATMITASVMVVHARSLWDIVRNPTDIGYNSGIVIPSVQPILTTNLIEKNIKKWEEATIDMIDLVTNQKDVSLISDIVRMASYNKSIADTWRLSSEDMWTYNDMTAYIKRYNLPGYYRPHPDGYDEYIEPAGIDLNFHDNTSSGATMTVGKDMPAGSYNFHFEICSEWFHEFYDSTLPPFEAAITIVDE